MKERTIIFKPGSIIKPKILIKHIMYIDSSYETHSLEVRSNETFLVLPRAKVGRGTPEFDDSWLTVLGCGVLMPFVINDYFARTIICTYSSRGT